MAKKVLVFTCLIFTLSINAFAEKGPYPNLPYKELIFADGHSFSPHSPSIVELPNGELFAVWYAATYGSGNSSIWSARRPVGADRWSDPSVIHSTPGLSNKNPVLYLGRDGRLWLFWSDEKRWFKWVKDILRVKDSGDSGKTWSKARDVGAPSGFLPRTHPVRLNDGRVVLPLYTDWNTSSAVLISEDDCLSWGRRRYILFLFGIQPTIIQRSDSSLFAMMRTGMWPRLCWQAVSYNFGDSWKVRGLSKVRNPGSSIEMIKLGSGNVVLVFNDSKSDRSGLSIALSRDEGRTWPHVKTIEFKKGQTNIYPSVIQDNRGLIHVLYAYDNRRSISHFVTDEQWIKAGNAEDTV